MLASEIHVGLRVLLQKVNTNKSKNFLPQELDMLFNLALNNYKNKKVDLTSNPKRVSLFDTQTSLDSLANLFETTELYPSTNNQKEATITLPFDFYGIINAKANIAQDCTGTTKINTNGLTNINCSLYDLKDLDFATLTSLTLSIVYKNKQNVNTTVEVFNYANLPDEFKTQDNVKDYKKSFIIINAMIKLINLKLSKINTISKNKIYIKYDNILERLVINSTEFLDVILDSNLTSLNIIKEQVLSSKLDLIVPLESPISVVDTEYETFIDNSSLSSSSPLNLKAVRTRDVLKVKLPKKVKLSSVTLTYIRFPRQIDYFLGIGSDLPIDIVNKIMADTAQLIKGIIASDSYEKFVNENTLIE